jgi:hypothetical protein
MGEKVKRLRGEKAPRPFDRLTAGRLGAGKEVKRLRGEEVLPFNLLYYSLFTVHGPLATDLE